MAKRYAPAQQDVSAQHNRLMYTLVKLLWLRSPQGSRSSPEKSTILKAYERVQHRILVEDPIMCKAGIPLPKINIKTVRDFIRRQERLLNLRATKQSSMLTKTTSISSAALPPAPHQPAVLPPPCYPLMEYVPTPSTAGTKVLKERTDILMPLSRPLPPLPLVLPPPQKNPATCTITRPVPCLSASTATAETAGPSTQPILPALKTPSIPPTLPTKPAAHDLSSPSWARSTKYKRKGVEQPSGVGVKMSRVHNHPVCSCCGQPTQGHKKYKRKAFCPVKLMSTSKGLDNTVYDSYEHFTSVVDKVEH